MISGEAGDICKTLNDKDKSKKHGEANVYLISLQVYYICDFISIVFIFLRVLYIYIFLEVLKYDKVLL